MKHHWEVLLKRLGYKAGQKIVDVGGAMDPVPIADVVIDAVNLGKGGKSYCTLDLSFNTFPFDDNHFDIAICSQTLEDLTNPIVAMREMSRVAKRGVIEVPHRGPESLKCVYPRRDHSYNEVYHFGAGHHKWLIEDIDGVMHFTPKVQYLLMRHPIPKWTGPRGVSQQWEDEIKYELHLDIYDEKIDQNYLSFRQKNKQYWE